MTIKRKAINSMAGRSRTLPLQRRQPVSLHLQPNPAAPGAQAALYRLMAWLSPSFPVGAFSYSSGIEWAVQAGDISDAVALRDWLAVMLTDGAGYCDGVLFAHAYRVAHAADALRTVAELAAALVPTRERFLETTAQGNAFVKAARVSWPCAPLEQLVQCDCAIAYPVAVGVAAAGHEVSLDQALSAYLQALVSNWTSAGIRLVPLGQTDGQRILAALEGEVAACVKRALGASLDDLGSSAFRADLASARHETQYTRLFRS